MEYSSPDTAASRVTWRMKILTILEKGALSAVLLGVILAPWLFGAAEPWAYLFIISLIDIGVVLWLVSVLLKRAEFVKLPAGFVPLCLLLLLLGFQLLPLPQSVTSLLSAQSAEIHADASQAFEASLSSAHTEQHIQPEGKATISVSPFKTRRALFLYVAYLGACLVLLNTITTREGLLRVAGVLSACAFALAVFAMMQYFTGTRAIYWFREPPLGGNIFGPYTNRNHCAAYINLALGPCLALALYYFARRTRTHKGSRRRKYARSDEVGQMMLYFFMACIMAGAVFLSLSRGAVASMIAAFGICGYLLVNMLGRDKRSALTAFGMVVLSVVVWTGWEPVLDRMGTLGEVAKDPVNDARTLATLCTLRVFAAFPLWGCGFGAFEHAFPAYQAPELQFGRWKHAHNDWAQALAEGGLVGILLILWILVAIFLKVRHSYMLASREDRFFVVGMTVAVIAIALHSFIDYSLHRPANALMLAVCVTLLVSYFALPEKGMGAPPVAPVYVVKVSATLRLIVLFLLVGVMGVMYLQRQELSGEAAAARLMRSLNAAISLEHNEDRAWVVKEAYRDMTAVTEGRVDPYTLIDIARISIRWIPLRNLDPAFRLRMADDAMRNTATAACFAPSDYEYWLWLARMKSLFGERESAEVCMAQARRLAPPGYAVAISPESR